MPLTIGAAADLAPVTSSHQGVVRKKFYDGIVFHRVIEGFMAQTGCPQGTGTGGSGQKLKAEFSKEKHVRGTASMARAQTPDSGDSQFFICFAAAPFLAGQYTVWGQSPTAGRTSTSQARRAGAENRTRSSRPDAGMLDPVIPGRGADRGPNP